MPIAIAPINIPLKIIRISNDPKIKKHLESLGLGVNSEIKIIASDKGNVIVEVKNVRLALDRVIANSIFVC